MKEHGDTQDSQGGKIGVGIGLCGLQIFEFVTSGEVHLQHV
jgi:hypothetical protein